MLADFTHDDDDDDVDAGPKNCTTFSAIASFAKTIFLDYVCSSTSSSASSASSKLSSSGVCTLPEKARERYLF